MTLICEASEATGLLEFRTPIHVAFSGHVWIWCQKLSDVTTRGCNYSLTFEPKPKPTSSSFSSSSSASSSSSSNRERPWIRCATFAIYISLFGKLSPHRPQESLKPIIYLISISGNTRYLWIARARTKLIYIVVRKLFTLYAIVTTKDGNAWSLNSVPHQRTTPIFSLLTNLGCDDISFPFQKKQEWTSKATLTLHIFHYDCNFDWTLLSLEHFCILFVSFYDLQTFVIYIFYMPTFIIPINRRIHFVNQVCPSTHWLSMITYTPVLLFAGIPGMVLGMFESPLQGFLKTRASCTSCCSLCTGYEYVRMKFILIRLQCANSWCYSSLLLLV